MHAPGGLLLALIMAERRHVCRQEKLPLFISVPGENSLIRKQNVGGGCVQALPAPCPPGPPDKMLGRAPRSLQRRGGFGPPGPFISRPEEVLGESVVGLVAVPEEKAM